MCRWPPRPSRIRSDPLTSRIFCPRITRMNTKFIKEFFVRLRVLRGQILLAFVDEPLTLTLSPEYRGEGKMQCDLQAATRRFISMALSPGSLTFQTKPTFSRARMVIQVRSICHHFRPWRALVGKAWWLLCQPSPKARRPKMALLRLSSGEA